MSGRGLIILRQDSSMFFFHPALIDRHVIGQIIIKPFHVIKSVRAVGIKWMFFVGFDVARLEGESGSVIRKMDEGHLLAVREL